ncbi:V-type proton ATPase subunit H isoform X1, partial [Pelobates cultripes]
RWVGWRRSLTQSSAVCFYLTVHWVDSSTPIYACSDEKLRGSGTAVEPGTVSPSDSSQYVQCVAGCLQLMLRVNEYRFAWVEADGVN